MSLLSARPGRGRTLDAEADTGPDLGADGDAGPGTGRRGRRRRLLLAAAVTVVVVVAVTWAVAFSPLFGARSVTVRGTHALTVAQVRAAARVPHGTPLVRLDTAAVTRRVERLPEVASAQVSTSFPSTVTITVVERVAVGYLRSGTQVLLVDRTGDAYRPAAAVPAGLPRLVVPTGAAARPARAAVGQVAAALPASLRGQVQSVDALDPITITLVLSHGRIVQWGSADDSTEKGRVLPILLAHARGDTTFVVADPQRPYSH